MEPIPGNVRISTARTGLDRGDNVRAAWSSVTGCMAGFKVGREGQATRKIRRAVQLPTTDQQIPQATDVASKPLAGAKWELVDLSEDEDVVAVVAVRAVVYALIVARGSSIIVGYSMLPGVVRVEGQTGRKALLHNHLESVVFVIEIVPEVTETLGPAKLGIEGSPRILRSGCSSTGKVGIVAGQPWIVEWIVWAAADSMRPLIADVGDSGAD